MGVPKWFRIPERSPWLETDWGKRLGATCYNIRRRGDYYRYSLLTTLFLHLILIFKDNMHG